jgi:predicted branched-subunit amino acid permease
LRPRSVVTFEILSLAAVALGILVSFLSWDTIVASARGAILGSGLEPAIAILLFFYVAVLVILILLASRRASNVARWVLALILVAELVFSVPGLGTMISAGTVGILSAVQLVMMVVAVVLLFAPESNRWFRGVADA